MIAGEGYGSDKIVAHEKESVHAKMVILSRSNRKQQLDYGKALDGLRNCIERCFNKLKQFRRFATGYEKSRACF